MHDELGWLLMSRRRPEAAIVEFRKAVELSQDPSEYLSLATAYVHAGKFPEALQEIRKAEELGGETTRVLEVRGPALALSGDMAGAQAIIDKLKSGKIDGPVAPYSLALVYTAMGKKSEAIDCLEKGYRENDPWVIYLGVLVDFDSLRSEPRFKDLLHRMNL